MRVCAQTNVHDSAAAVFERLLNLLLRDVSVHVSNVHGVKLVTLMMPRRWRPLGLLLMAVLLMVGAGVVVAVGVRGLLLLLPADAAHPDPFAPAPETEVGPVHH